MLRISAYQIEKSYSTVKAVNRISFDVQSGQIFALTKAKCMAEKQRFPEK